MEEALEQVNAVLTEVKVINSVLKTSDKQALYAPSVDDLFSAYRDVWDYVKEYHNNYGDMPSFDLIQERFDGEIEDVNVPGSASHYVDTLRAEYVNNRVESLLTRASLELRDGTSPSEIKAKLQTALDKLDRFSSVSRDLSIMDTVEAKRHYDEVRAKAEAMGGTPGVPTGLDFVDACMPLGMQAGDIISLIGYPARGKSALGTLFSAKAIMRGYKPLIFSREMSAEAVRDRIYTVMGSGLFSNSDLMLGNVNSDEFREFSNKNTGGEGWIVDGNGSGDMTPNFMRGKIDQHRPDFVLLDYLQLFHDNGLSEDMTARMRNLSLQIKSLSNQTQVPFVVISSATPDGGKVDGPPNVERSAWSRQLAYDSTVCIAVHRQDDTNMYQIECAKNRYGPLFSGFLDWDMDRGVYEEMTELH